MPHPGDDGSLGSLLDGDALRPGDGSASYRRGMIRYGTGQALGEISVICMKGQERDHRPQEVFNVLGLGFVTAVGIS